MGASVGSDGRLCIWDLRKKGNIPVTAVDAHPGGALTAAFAPSSGGILATGGHDQLVCLWDLRQLSCFRKLVGHTEDIRRVAWSGGDPGHLASSDVDGLVVL